MLFLKALLLLFAIALRMPAAAAANCEALAKLTLPNTTITLAQSVAAGSLKIHPKYFPASLPGTPPLKELPPFCRVAADIMPTKDSEIHIEVWMPLSRWNGKFLGAGNGGFSGAIWYPLMGLALARGYATAGSDTGHEGTPDDASFISQPEKLIDYAYRAPHEMTVKAKAIVEAFYGKPANHSYWDGCSAGGKQALIEAQRFPADYDGILVGAPANFWTHLMASGIWASQALSNLPEEKQTIIHKAVLESCDMLDGVKDGVLEDPTSCHFDPNVLLCKEADGPNCLTLAQVEAARKIYAGARNPRSGEQVFPGFEPGSELEWDFYRARPQSEPLSTSYFKALFGSANWDSRRFDFDSDIARADKRHATILNTTDPNLKPFVSRGGKLILYHGWNDGAIAPLNTVNYYNNVVATLGWEMVEKSIRLFMIPGQTHCGEGRWLFDAIGALENWVERQQPPVRIVASHFSKPGFKYSDYPVFVQISRWSSALGSVDRTRPLCRYSQVAKYTGHGSTDNAANFECTEPQR